MEEKSSERGGVCIFKKKERLKDQRQVSIIWVKERRDEHRDVDQMENCLTKQEQNDKKICLQF